MIKIVLVVVVVVVVRGHQCNTSATPVQQQCNNSVTTV
jgi:hypothetical protein